MILYFVLIKTLHVRLYCSSERTDLLCTLTVNSQTISTDLDAMPTGDEK